MSNTNFYYTILSGQRVIGALPSSAVITSGLDVSNFGDMINVWLMYTGRTASVIPELRAFTNDVEFNNNLAKLATGWSFAHVDDIPSADDFEVVGIDDVSYYVIGSEDQDYGLKVVTLQTVEAWHETWDGVESTVDVAQINWTSIRGALIAGLQPVASPSVVMAPVVTTPGTVTQPTVTVRAETPTARLVPDATAQRSPSDEVLFAPGFFGAPACISPTQAALSKLKAHVGNKK